MASLVQPPPLRIGGVQRLLGLLALLLALLLGAAIARQAMAGGIHPAAMPPWLRLHLLTVIPALPLGAWLLLRPKGTMLHRRLGQIWCGLMVVTALASFGTLMGPNGRLSWIHAFSILTLWGVPRLIWFARTHRVMLHRRVVTSVYGGLVGAGLFVFLPSRMLGHWLFG